MKGITYLGIYVWAISCGLAWVLKYTDERLEELSKRIMDLEKERHKRAIL